MSLPVLRYEPVREAAVSVRKYICRSGFYRHSQQEYLLGRQYPAGTQVESSPNQRGFSTMTLNQRLFNVHSSLCIVLVTFIGNGHDRTRC